MIKVGKGDGYDYGSIQLAINKANAGDTIEVHEGTYHEQITVNKKLTIKGVGKAVVDGRAGEGGVNNGLPSGRIAKTAAGTGYGYTHSNLVNINADGTVWDGIDIIRSLGAGLAVYKSGGKISNVQIRNCKLNRNRHRGLELLSPKDIVIENVSMYQNVQWVEDSIDAVHGANMNGRDVDGLKMIGCTVAASFGEAVMIDANHYESKNLEFINCEFYDNLWGNLNIAGSSNIVIDGCLIYSSDNHWQPSKPNEWIPKGLTLRGREPELGDFANWHGIRNAEVRNTIFVGGAINFVFGGGYKKTSSGKVLDPMRRLENVRFVNNTIVNGRNAMMADNNPQQNDIWFANNLIVQSNKRYFTNGGRTDGWTTVKNLFSPQPPKELADRQTNIVASNPNSVVTNASAAVLHGQVDVTNYAPLESVANAASAANMPDTDFFGNQRTNNTLGAIDFGGEAPEPPEPPDPPEPPEPGELAIPEHTVSVSGQEITVDWLAVDGATGYKVQHVYGSSKDKVDVGDTLVYEIPGAEIGNHTFKVLAYNADEQTVWSDPITVKVDGEPPEPPEPPQPPEPDAKEIEGTLEQGDDGVYTLTFEVVN